MQRLIPREVLSRVSSFDAMGTMLLRPVGLALAAPLAGLIGITRTLESAAVFSLVVLVVILAVPEVRNLSFRDLPAVPDPSLIPQVE